MRVPISWLREYVDLPESVDGRVLAAGLIRMGLEVETVETIGAVSGPVVVGRVEQITELTEFKKPIRFCQVDVGAGPDALRDIVCGANNFAVGDLVVVALPDSELPGGFAISARKTYGYISDGMICSSAELDLGDDHDGIMVLPAGSAPPGEPAAALLGLGEDVLDIAVTPDRGYALSIRGVAREAAIAFAAPFRDRAMELADLPAPTGEGREPVGCHITDPAGCDLFTTRTLVGVDTSAPTPLWMKQRLIAAGMRSVGVVVDVTNYVMLATGQPLHAFDADALSGGLTARRAKPGERLETLDHVLRELDSADLVIADDSRALALAGTMGGLNSEIADDSSNIVIEAAHFDPITVAKMSRRHKLSSEASRRFERGVDRNVAAYASGMAAALLVELTGASNVGLVAEEVPADASPITMAGDYPARVAGMEIPTDKVIGDLELVGCTVTAVPGADGAQTLRVLAPSWRPDLTDPADLAEEVIRIIGYDQIPSRLPRGHAGRGLTRVQQLRRRASRVAASLGLTETLTYPFIGESDLSRAGISLDDPLANLVVLANPLSDEQPGLRTMLLPGLLAVARRNVSRGADSVRVFEVGSVFFPSPGSKPVERFPVKVRPTADQIAELNQLLPEQPLHVGAVLTGAWERPGWWGAGRPIDWSDAMAAAVRIASELNVTLKAETGTFAPFHPGRCAALTLGDKAIGYAGELHPKVAAQWDLPARSVAFELDLGAVIDAGVEVVVKAPDFSAMPVAKEDVALVVSSETPAADVQQALRDGAGPLLETVRLFDVYDGPQVGEGLKSLAYALRFRAPDRTLALAEVAAARDAAVAQAVQKCGAVLRGPA
ncbi:MAG: phenylalanine--tRNA ligase subunit beta [Candidatus Nanopelagicales bacterium]